MIDIDLLKNVPISDTTKIKSVEFLNKYKSGYYLYKNVLQRNIKETNQAASLIIEILIDNNIVEEMHYFMCPRCSEQTGVYSTNHYFDDNIICERCGETICNITNDIVDISNSYTVYQFK